MIRGDLKNVECIIPLIHHMYRSFLRVVHLKSLLIFGSRLKRRVPFSLGLITQTSIIIPSDNWVGFHPLYNPTNQGVPFKVAHFAGFGFGQKLEVVRG